MVALTSAYILVTSVDCYSNAVFSIYMFAYVRLSYKLLPLDA